MAPAISSLESIADFHKRPSEIDPALSHGKHLQLDQTTDKQCSGAEVILVEYYLVNQQMVLGVN